ncbi:MAG: hypothetical protein Ta2A_01080 [Treponemataceae bacterium]|nr:MAG: hypothetical protein Ta2A_01080 [Treponemataceae bacterium]
MKKKFAFVVLGITLFCGFGYAQTEVEDYFELGGTFMSMQPGSLKYPYTGGGINFAGVSRKGNVFGWGAYANFVHMAVGEVTLINIDMLLGPAFKIKINERFRLPIAFGVYIMYPFAFASSGAASGFNFGVGGNITAEFSLNDKVHLYGRVQGSYSILPGVGSIAPSLGIGWKTR